MNKMSNECGGDNSVIVSLENISKVYPIYKTPRDRLHQFVMPRIRRMAGLNHRNYYQEFLALSSISLKIRRGETIGIIGKNGSGKSTLLQIISGVLEPTAGKIIRSGRIAALLELGSGFNPEFSGRENIYLNAKIYGLNNSEIDDRFEEIVKFSGIGNFLDRPVKTYSSGMYVRLAFSVIAHVDADILIVDEALAVGDAAFNHKCMRFIREFQKRGTLIFVSHSMESVINLCENAIWLDNGCVIDKGNAKLVCEEYLRSTLESVYEGKEKLNKNSTHNDNNEKQFPPVISDDLQGVDADQQEPVFSVTNMNLDSARGWKTGVAEIDIIDIYKNDEARNMRQTLNDQIFKPGENITVYIEGRCYSKLNEPIIGFIIRDKLGQDLFGENTFPVRHYIKNGLSPGQRMVAEFSFTLPMLQNGDYALMASIADGDVHVNTQHHYMHDALLFKVFSSKVRYGLVGIPIHKIHVNILEAIDEKFK